MTTLRFPFNGHLCCVSILTLVDHVHQPVSANERPGIEMRKAVTIPPVVAFRFHVTRVVDGDRLHDDSSTARPFHPPWVQRAAAVVAFACLDAKYGDRWLTAGFYVS